MLYVNFPLTFSTETQFFFTLKKKQISMKKLLQNKATRYCLALCRAGQDDLSIKAAF